MEKFVFITKGIGTDKHGDLVWYFKLVTFKTGHAHYQSISETYARQLIADNPFEYVDNFWIMELSS